HTGYQPLRRGAVEKRRVLGWKFSVFEKSLERRFVGFEVPPSGGSTPRPPEGGTPNGTFQTDSYPSSFHPWASRTAIMERKMSFHVCCFIMTSFGNMHPSQHMWKNCLVNSP